MSPESLDRQCILCGMGSLNPLHNILTPSSHLYSFSVLLHGETELYCHKSAFVAFLFCFQQGGIRCLQFNEQYIVSGSWDMSIRVWDIVKFTQVALLSGHSGVVSCLQFNKNYL